MCTDSNVVSQRLSNRSLHALRITGMTTAGDVATRDDAEKLDILGITLTQICIEIDRRGHDFLVCGENGYSRIAVLRLVYTA